MKKWNLLNADQKKVRIILVISAVLGLASQATYLIDNLKKGINLDLTLIGGSILVALAVTIGIFFAITVALMEKEKRVL